MATAEAKLLAGHHDVINIESPKAAPASGEVLVLADNRVGVVTGLNLADIVIGDKIAVAVSGPVRLPIASAKVVAAGTAPFWDVSGNTVLPVADGGLENDVDAVVGTSIKGSANGVTFVDVDLNAAAGTLKTA